MFKLKKTREYWTWYYLHGGREKKILYARFYRRNIFSLKAGTPINLSLRCVNGKLRVINAVRLERWRKRYDPYYDKMIRDLATNE